MRLGFEVDRVENEHVVSPISFHLDLHMYEFHFIPDSLVTSSL